VAEGVDAVAVDVRHGPRAAELEIPADEHHADGVTRLDRGHGRYWCSLAIGNDCITTGEGGQWAQGVQPSRNPLERQPAPFDRM